MRIISGRNLKFDRNTVVTFGKFDGIHKGHRLLFEKAIEIGRGNHLEVVVFTFQMDAIAGSGQKVNQHITTVEQRRKIFEKLGIDTLVEYPLDMVTASMEPLEFIQKIIKDQLMATYIVVGQDWHFGVGRSGDVNTLKQWESIYNYQAVIVPKEIYHNKEISSSWIRDEIKEGNMENAYILLGNPYTIMGKVLHGNKIGRTLGFPTINIEPEADKILPPYGVYASKISYNNIEYFGMTNVGVRPTVTNDKKVVIETYLFGFDQEIYQETLDVQLFHYERPEIKYDNLEELKKQMKYDVEYTKSYFMI